MILETYSPPKLNREEIYNLNRLITRSETDSVTKKTNKQNHLVNNSPGPDAFKEEFKQTYKELVLILFNCSKRLKRTE